MSRTQKTKPFWKKRRSMKIDKEPKKTIHAIIQEDENFEEYSVLNKLKINIVYILILVAAITMSACVTKKSLLEEVEKSNNYKAQATNCTTDFEQLRVAYEEQNNRILSLENQIANEKNKTLLLSQQLDYFKNTNTNLLDRLSDLSVVNKTGAESIKKSLEALNKQNSYIKDLTSTMRYKDSLNLALVMNLKRSLADINDDDVKVEVKKGVVYISISDKLLFKSGSAEINTKADEVLGKIAKVLNDHAQLEILVEGHTDNIPIQTACISDNWDLSTKRATSVVRLLQSKYKISPERMTAGGRSEYIPKLGNETSEGRAANRRTEIIVLPQLDQFFKLLEPPSGKK